MTLKRDLSDFFAPLWCWNRNRGPSPMGSGPFRGVINPEILSHYSCYLNGALSTHNAMETAQLQRLPVAVMCPYNEGITGCKYRKCINWGPESQGCASHSVLCLALAKPSERPLPQFPPPSTFFVPGELHSAGFLVCEMDPRPHLSPGVCGRSSDS